MQYVSLWREQKIVLFREFQYFWLYITLSEYLFDILGVIGTDGTECQTFCQSVCSADQMTCPGGIDYNGCPVQDSCISLEGKRKFDMII